MVDLDFDFNHIAINWHVLILLFRFNAILPIMEPQFVIVKIVDAVLTNKQIVILPKIVNFVTGLK